MSSFLSSILLTSTWYIILLFFKVAQRWKVKRERLRPSWKGSKWGAKRINRLEITVFLPLFLFPKDQFYKEIILQECPLRKFKEEQGAAEKQSLKVWSSSWVYSGNWTLIFLYFQVIWIGYGRHQCEPNHLWRDLNSMVSINVHLKEDTHWEPDRFMINWDSNRTKLGQLFPGGGGTAVVEMEQLIFSLEVRFQKEICIPREQKFIDFTFSAVTIIW